jgi:hypothetical protein
LTRTLPGDAGIEGFDTEHVFFHIAGGIKDRADPTSLAPINSDRGSDRGQVFDLGSDRGQVFDLDFSAIRSSIL